MNSLSKEVFGSATRWRKLRDQGVLEVKTHTIVELVPGEDGSEAVPKETKVPDTVNGRPVKVRRYYSEQELFDLMTERKQQFEEAVAKFQAEQKAQAEAKDAEKLQKQVHNAAVGSAV